MNFQSIAPDKFGAIYGALVAGGAAVIVAYLSNRHAFKRLNLELQHQTEQKERERQFALRRDIYVPLLEAASSAMSYYGQIGTVPSELFRQPEPLNALARQIAKLNVIASKRID